MSISVYREAMRREPPTENLHCLETMAAHRLIWPGQRLHGKRLNRRQDHTRYNQPASVQRSRDTIDVADWEPGQSDTVTLISTGLSRRRSSAGGRSGAVSAWSTGAAMFCFTPVAADDMRELSGRNVIVPAPLFVEVHIEIIQWVGARIFGKLTTCFVRTIDGEAIKSETDHRGMRLAVITPR